MPSIFNFVEKEGKYFAPIVSRQANYVVSNGAVVESGTKIVSGTKGVYGKVRFTSNSTSKAELFAVNTQASYSSD